MGDLADGLTGSDVCLYCECTFGLLPTPMHLIAPTSVTMMGWVQPANGTSLFNFHSSADGTYTLTLTIRSTSRNVTILIDATPPTVLGLISNLPDSDRMHEPAAAAESQWSGVDRRWALVTLRFSEPLSGFEPSSRLRVQQANITAIHWSPKTNTYLVTLVGQRGHDMFLRLYQHDYKDVVGNLGANNASLQLSLQDTNTNSQLESAASAGGLASAIALVTSLTTKIVMPAASFGQALAAKSALMHSSYHVQMLAMTSQLASPGLSLTYRTLARYLRWSVLSLKGSMPAFDDAFTNSETPDNPAPDASWTLAPNLAEEPSADGGLGNFTDVSHVRRRHLSAYPIVGDVSSLSDVDVNSMLVDGFAQAVSLRRARSAAAADLSHLPTVYARRLVQTTAPSAPPPPADLGNTSGNLSVLYQADTKYMVDFQDLLYTLAIAAIIMCAVVVIHVILILAYKIFISSELHPYLAFPRIEFVVGGLLIIALTFYSCLALGGPAEEWHDSKTAAVIVLLLLTLPYALFLWWLALGRMFTPFAPDATPVVAYPQGKADWYDTTLADAHDQPASAVEKLSRGSSKDIESDEDSSSHPSSPWRKTSGTPSPTIRATAPDDSVPSYGVADGLTGSIQQGILPASLPNAPPPGRLSAAFNGPFPAGTQISPNSRNGSKNGLKSGMSGMSGGGHNGFQSGSARNSDRASVSTNSSSGHFSHGSGHHNNNNLYGSASFGSHHGGRTHRNISTASNNNLADPPPPASAGPFEALMLTRTSPDASLVMQDMSPRARPLVRDAFSISSAGAASARLSIMSQPDDNSHDFRAPTNKLAAQAVAEGAESTSAVSPSVHPLFALNPTLGPRLSPGSMANSTTAHSSPSTTTTTNLPSRGSAWHPGAQQQQQQQQYDASGMEAGAVMVDLTDPDKPSSHPQEAAFDTTVEGTAVDAVQQQQESRLSASLKWLLPSDAMLRRFHFTFEDTLGEEGTEMRDPRSFKTIATAANFTHKACCAIAFGCYGLQRHAWTQLILLLVAQSVLLGYLLLAWPYITWQLQWMEVSCHTLEAVIFVLAMVLMNLEVIALDWVLMACFFLVVAVIVAYEIWRVYVVLRSLYAAWRARREGGVVVQQPENQQ